MLRWGWIAVLPSMLFAVPALPDAAPSQGDIEIVLLSQGMTVPPGERVSGVVTARVTVRRAAGLSAQAYVNLTGYASAHHLTTDAWVNEFSIDTRAYFDGMQLLNVHVHPHGHTGEPSDSTAFRYATRAFETGNGRLPPGGFRRLPTLEHADLYVYESAARPGLRLIGEPFIADWDQGNGPGAPSNIILGHANMSILGAQTWSTNDLHDTFRLSGPVRDVLMFPYQAKSERPFKLVWFFMDALGRANLEERTIFLPPSASPAPLPLPDARVLDLEEFSEVVAPVEGAPMKLRVLVSNVPGPFAPEKMDLRLWVGNDPVAVVPMDQLLAQHVGQSEFTVDIPIDVFHLARHQKNLPTVAATATAVWVDFQTEGVVISGGHLPTSSHIHVNSFRTDQFGH